MIELEKKIEQFFFLCRIISEVAAAHNYSNHEIVLILLYGRFVKDVLYS